MKLHVARVVRTVKAAERVIVELGITRKVPIKIKGQGKLPVKINLAFKSSQINKNFPGADVLAHIIDTEINFVKIRNYFTQLLIIERHFRLG